MNFSQNNFHKKRFISRGIKLCFAFSLCLLYSCKKDNTLSYTITGTVADKFTNTSIANVQLDLEVQEFTGGNFSNVYKAIESVTTDGQGNYNFTFDRRNASSYRISIHDANHFSQEMIINPDNLNGESDNIIDFALAAKGWLTVNLKNTAPFNNNDVVTYQLSNGYDGGTGTCGNDAVFNLLGTTVDTTFTCLNEANTDVTLQAFFTRDNTGGGSISQNVSIISGDTVYVNMHY